jgi:hypothetical protein
MATKKRQQTMAKREREQNVRDRRTEKLLKKRNLAAERSAGIDGTEESPVLDADASGETEESPSLADDTPEPS